MKLGNLSERGAYTNERYAEPEEEEGTNRRPFTTQNTHQTHHLGVNQGHSGRDETKTALVMNDALQGHVSNKSAGMRAM